MFFFGGIYMRLTVEKAMELLEEYELTSKKIIDKVQEILKY